MKIPPYFIQENKYTCSLAALRMALAYFGITVTESELEKKVETDYGKNFKNLWNPTIAKLACEYGLNTLLSADWPLLKDGVIQQAMKAYKEDSENFNVNKYENPNDTDHPPEPLPLAYKEMFRAVEKRCKTAYGSLTAEKISELLTKGYLIQTSIKLHLMYPGSKHTFHSILIYGIDGNTVYFHDPAKGAQLTCSVEHLLKATMDVGAWMGYRKG